VDLRKKRGDGASRRGGEKEREFGGGWVGLGADLEDLGGDYSIALGISPSLTAGLGPIIPTAGEYNA